MKFKFRTEAWRWLVCTAALCLNVAVGMAAGFDPLLISGLCAVTLMLVGPF